jgi:hypothetical protein
MLRGLLACFTGGSGRARGAGEDGIEATSIASAPHHQQQQQQRRARPADAVDAADAADAAAVATSATTTRLHAPLSPARDLATNRSNDDYNNRDSSARGRPPQRLGGRPGVASTAATQAAATTSRTTPDRPPRPPSPCAPPPQTLLSALALRRGERPLWMSQQGQQHQQNGGAAAQQLIRSGSGNSCGRGGGPPLSDAAPSSAAVAAVQTPPLLAPAALPEAAPTIACASSSYMPPPEDDCAGSLSSLALGGGGGLGSPLLGGGGAGAGGSISAGLSISAAGGGGGGAGADDRDRDRFIGGDLLRLARAEANMDSLLEGGRKSGAALFARYDMRPAHEGGLRRQDLYDLMLELALSLPYEQYAQLIDWAFSHADSDGDGRLSLEEFLPLYRALCAARRAFRRVDHHRNGQIDRYDMASIVADLGVVVVGGGGGGGGGLGGGVGLGNNGTTGTFARPSASTLAPTPSSSQPPQHQPYDDCTGGAPPPASTVAHFYGESLGGRLVGADAARVRAHVERAFELADTRGSGTVNFGGVLLWYANQLWRGGRRERAAAAAADAVAADAAAGGGGARGVTGAAGGGGGGSSSSNNGGSRTRRPRFFSFGSGRR